MAKLSIIILSYNTRDITLKCLQSLISSLKDVSFNTEIIVVDNASVDGSPEMLNNFVKQSTSKIKIITVINKENQGFPKGNNTGVREANGQYILFLNSDVIIQKVNWEEILSYMDENRPVGALTVKVELPSGSIDPASHRGFPTLWNSISYYSGLEKLTSFIPGLNRIFGGYHLKHLDLSKIHIIDSPSGAFFLTRKDLFNNIGRFDETFFMYGEDLDLAYRIKEEGNVVVYYPRSSVLHLKYQSGLQNSKKQTKSKTKGYFYDAMKIFYKKHYANNYPSFVNNLVYFFIELKEKLS